MFLLEGEKHCQSNRYCICHLTGSLLSFVIFHQRTRNLLFQGLMSKYQQSITFIKPRILHVSEQRVRLHTRSIQSIIGNLDNILAFLDLHQNQLLKSKVLQMQRLEFIYFCLYVSSLLFKELGIQQQTKQVSPSWSLYFREGIDSMQTVKYILSGSVNVQKKKKAG